MEWEPVLKAAKSCNTKIAWETLFFQYETELSNTKQSRILQDLFKWLRADPQCLVYDARIFAILVNGCLSSWDLELGHSICEFAEKITKPIFAIPAARLLLECGHPAKARQFAARALRHASLTDSDWLNLKMLVATSHAQDAKHTKAINMLASLKENVAKSDLPSGEVAALHAEMGRILFFLGRYLDSAEAFAEAADIFVEERDWENAVKTLFNTAMCYHNGGERIEEGFEYVERARRIAEDHSFAGPLSHIESFYGLDAFQHGNFAQARDYFRRSLQLIPPATKAYRRLHVLSMLALTHLIMGRYRMAKRIGQETIELAKHDESDIYRMRYISLESELLWEDGRILESQNLLQKALQSFRRKGIHTLEELYTCTRYFIQSAMLGNPVKDANISVDPDLEKNSYNWLDYRFAHAQTVLSLSRCRAACADFTEIEASAREHDNKYHLALGILGQIECRLAGLQIDDVLEQRILALEIAVSRIGDTPLRARVHFANAALNYHRGDFEGCIRSLKACLRSQKISYADRLVATCWLDTAEGRSSKLQHPWQFQIVARFTRIYFAPIVEALNDQEYLISKVYRVNLDRTPALARLIQYLIGKGDYSASAEEVQTDVWRQNLQMTGYQQKIRNAIMRVRDVFPYTMAPLIIHGERIELFDKAIKIRPAKNPVDRESEILRLTREKPMTSGELSERLQVSAATIKRDLGKLTADNAIIAQRDGRRVRYMTHHHP